MVNKNLLLKSAIKIHKHEDGMLWIGTLSLACLSASALLENLNAVYGRYLNSALLFVCIVSVIVSSIGLWYSRRRRKRIRKQFDMNVPFSLYSFLITRYSSRLSNILGKYNEPVRESIMLTSMFVMVINIIWRSMLYKAEVNLFIILFFVTWWLVMFFLTWYMFYLKYKEYKIE